MGMPQAAVPQLQPWTNFYVIVGSAAGALTGLQFVVLTLIAQARVASSTREIRAFASPTIVHFFAALVISAIASAPWETLSAAATCLAAFGVLGVAYLISVIRHTRKQTGYQPDTEDWIWYTVLPLAAYAALAAAAVVMPRRAGGCLFAVAAITLGLLVVGLHNAWDTITYVAVSHLPAADKPKE